MLVGLAFVERQVLYSRTRVHHFCAHYGHVPDHNYDHYSHVHDHEEPDNVQSATVDCGPVLVPSHLYKNNRKQIPPVLVLHLFVPLQQKQPK